MPKRGPKGKVRIIKVPVPIDVEENSNDDDDVLELVDSKKLMDQIRARRYDLGLNTLTTEACIILAKHIDEYLQFVLKESLKLEKQRKISIEDESLRTRYNEVRGKLMFMDGVLKTKKKPKPVNKIQRGFQEKTNIRLTNEAIRRAIRDHKKSSTGCDTQPIGVADMLSFLESDPYNLHRKTLAKVYVNTNQRKNGNDLKD
ncbi:uncharacterized protein LOC119662399 [Teleopsis dalmanni]|uniref:uncharacterized protein LOC119662399 n=1 Tax=Teleopsis dalmanni TaxID=139649 RepID=UPI0018CD7867|nr:uncharacterized protein LOC119662399 [Teleopsis dalmanni]